MPYNLPPLWGSEGGRTWERAQGASQHFWARSWGVTPLGLGISALPEGLQPARSHPSRGNATSTSVPDEWLSLASQETVGLHPGTNALLFPLPRPERKREQEKREVRGLVAKQGRNGDKALIVQGHTQPPRQSRPGASASQDWSLELHPGFVSSLATLTRVSVEE